MRRWWVGVLLCAMLGGCVTTTNSIFTRKENKTQAEKDYIQLGLAYTQKGEYEVARQDFQKALAINSDSAGALAGMGLLYQIQDEPDLAEESFQKALHADPSYTRGRTFYGAFLYSQGRYQDCYDQFSRAAQDFNFTDRSLIYTNLGRCAEKIGRTDEAIDAFRKSLGINRQNIPTLLGLTQALVDANRYTEARHYDQQMNDLINASPSIHPSAESLWVSIRIAHHFQDADREASLALLLGNLYPKSKEYKQYKALISHE